MDIESFHQCLIYTSTTLETKPLIEKALPVIGALTGALIGFSLNYLTTLVKDSRETKNKIMCCNEDIDRLQLSLKEILKELYSLAERIHNKKEMKSHTLPTSLNILYLDEYFIDVAHKFNKEQRATIQNIFSEMQELNANLTSLKKRESQIDRFALSRLLSNFTLLALNTYKNCKSIKNKSQPTDSGLINELEITTDQVQSLKQIRINIINENSTLNL